MADRKKIPVDNPYQPPAAPAPAEPSPSSARLFKVSGVGLATFFSSVMGGGLLMAANYRALGEHDKARRAFLYSLLGGVAALGVAFMLPDGVGYALALTLLQLVVMVWLAKREQGHRIASDRRAGSRPRSNWLAVGIGLLVLIVQFVVVIAIALALHFAGVIDLTE